VEIGSAIFERRATSGEDASPERASSAGVGAGAKSRRRARHFRFVQQKRDCSKSNGDGKRLGVTVLYLVMLTVL